MEFLCYHRDRPGSVVLRDELAEAHWSYMDRYATQMIARGPTLAADGDTPTGSRHVTVFQLQQLGEQIVEAASEADV